MKKFLRCLALITLLYFTAKAQSPTQATTSKTAKHRIDQNSIVQDSSGMIYPYIAWRKIMASGDYSLRPINPGSDSTAYLLYRMTDAQKKAMIERMPKPAESPFFVTGSEFRPFKDKALDGTKIDLKALRGKVVVLNFWFINCPPCRMEIPELNKIAAEYKDKDVVFVAVALDQGYEIKDFLKTTPYNYHIVSDGRYTANKYGITSYPTNVVIDKDGIIKFHSSGYGASTAVWIRKSIDQAM